MPFDESLLEPVTTGFDESKLEPAEPTELEQWQANRPERTPRKTGFFENLATSTGKPLADVLGGLETFEKAIRKPDDERLKQILKDEMTLHRMEQPTTAGGIGATIGGLGGQIALTTLGTMAGAPPQATMPLQFGLQGFHNAFVSAGIRALQEGKTFDEAVDIGKKAAVVGGVAQAGVGLIGGKAKPSWLETGLEGAKFGLGLGGAQAVENIGQQELGLHTPVTEGVGEAALTGALLPPGVRLVGAAGRAILRRLTRYPTTGEPNALSQQPATQVGLRGQGTSVGEETPFRQPRTPPPLPPEEPGQAQPPPEDVGPPPPEPQPPPPVTELEHPVEAAFRDKTGFIWTGSSHPTTLNSMPPDLAETAEMGFVTNRGRFVGYEHGLRLGQAHYDATGQVNIPVPAPPPKPEPHWRVAVQATEGDVPGFVQIAIPGAAENTQSPTMESLRAAGHDVPDFTKLPTGRYTWEEATKLLEKPPQPTPPPTPPAPPPPVAPGLTQPNLLEVPRLKTLAAERIQIQRILAEMQRRREAGEGPLPSQQAEDNLTRRLAEIEQELYAKLGQPPTSPPGVDVRAPTGVSPESPPSGPPPPTPRPEGAGGIEAGGPVQEPEGVKRGRGIRRGGVPSAGPAGEPGKRPAPAVTPEGTAGGSGPTGIPPTPVPPVEPTAPPSAPEAKPAAPPPEPVSVGQNHVLPREQDWIPTGDKSKVRANIDAIKLLKQLEAEQRPATPEEQAVLARYTGWGGLKEVFDKGKAAYRERPPWNEEQRKESANWEKNWGKLYDEVKASLTDEEYQSASRSILNAHYTSREVINSMWQAIERLGFKGGRALEPSAGVGNFIGLTPPELRDRTQWNAVELDSVSGRILQRLYPSTRTVVTGFEKARVPLNSQDLVVTNVPFNAQGPSDARYPNFSLHNYFIARALDLTRPGGIVAVISSDSTMDSPSSQQARAYIGERADLVGAIRLPNTAFKKNAGTEVTTDILFFRKRDGTPFRGEDFLRTVPAQTYKGEPIEINEYFAKHPDMMLGKMSLEGTMYGPDQQALLPSGDLPTQLQEAIGKLPQDVFGSTAAEPTEAPRYAETTGKIGELRLVDGVPHVVTPAGTLEPVDWAGDRKKVEQAKRYINLVNAVSGHIQRMLDPNSVESEIESGRADLNKLYDDYRKKHGPINARASSFLDDDVNFPLALALEDANTRMETVGGQVRRVTDWIKSKLFSERTIFPRVAPTRVDTVGDGLQGRNFEDAANEISLTFEEQMAAFSGDPRAMQKVALENQVRQLEILRSGHAEQLRKARETLQQLQGRDIPYAERRLAQSAARLAKFGQEFQGELTLRVGDTELTGRENIAKALDGFLKQAIERTNSSAKVHTAYGSYVLPIGEVTLNGEPITLTGSASANDKGVLDPTRTSIRWGFNDGGEGGNVTTGTGFLHSLQGALERIQRQPERDQGSLEKEQRNLREMSGFVQQPFEREAELQEAKTKLSTLTSELAAEAKGPEKPDAVVEKLDEWIDKTDPLQGGQVLEGVLGAPVWLTKSLANGALKIIKSAYILTRDLARAIQAGVDWLREQNIEHFDEGKAAEWLHANFDPHRGEVRDTTQRMSVLDSIMARAGQSVDTDAHSVQRTGEILREAGLSSVVEPNESAGGYLFKGDGKDYNEQGQRLIRLLGQEFSNYDQPGRAPVHALINTIRLNHERGALNDVFPGREGEAIRLKLFSLTQYEASLRGQLLQALQRIGTRVTEIGQDVRTWLSKDYWDKLGGDAYDAVMERIRTELQKHLGTEAQGAITPELEQFFQRMLAANRREEGGRVYRRVQQLLKPKSAKRLSAMESDARVQEAVRKILADAAGEGIVPKPVPGKKKLSPLEELLHLVNPETSGKIEELVAKAVEDAENNAGWRALEGEMPPEEIAQRRADGERPPTEAIERGLDLPQYSHWATIRDVLTGYSPVTLAMARDVIRGDFRNVRFDPKKPRPTPMKIDMAKLAVSPDAEVRRVLDGWMDALDSMMGMSDASDGTRQRIRAMMEQELVGQLEQARAEVRTKAMAGPPAKPGQPLTPEQRTAQLINAKLFADPRLDIPEYVGKVAQQSKVKALLPSMSGLVRQVLETPWFHQDSIRDRFIEYLLDELSMPPEQVAGAWKVFNEAFASKFAEAKAKAFERATASLESLTPKERAVWKKKGQLKRIEEAVNAGVLDTGEVMRKLASERGWRPPSDGDVERIRKMAEDEMRLRTLPPDQVRRLEGDPNALARAQMELERATLERRAEIKKQMHVMLSRMIHPLTFDWKSKDILSQLYHARENIAYAGNEWVANNLLATLGFPIRQASQILSHMPVYGTLRAVGHAIQLHNLNSAEGGIAFWKDLSQSLGSEYKARLASLRSTLSETASAFRQRGQNRNVERLTSSVQLMERIDAKAKELWDQKRYAASTMLHLAGLLRVGYRLAAASDAFHGNPAEHQEMIFQVRKGLRENGATRAQAEEGVAKVLEIMRNSYPEAVATAQRLLEVKAAETGAPPPTKGEIGRAAWQIVKGMGYHFMRTSGLAADDFMAHNEELRQQQGWNERETRGPGGLVAHLGRGAQQMAGEAGLPLPLASFSNAIGIMINRALHFTPLYGLTNIGKKGEVSPWFRTPSDVWQRRLEAAAGTGIGSAVFAMVLKGALTVWTKPPRDPEERDLWERQGHRAGTVEVNMGGGKFQPWSLTTSPFFMVAPYLAAGQALRDLLEGRQKRQQKLNEEAAKRGLVPGKINPINASDAMGLAGEAAWGMIMGGRTASGLIAAATDYGVPNASKFIASQVGPFIPGQPELRELARMAGVSLNTKLASFWDFLVPLPTSGARRVNLLGDPAATPNDAQRMIQVLTGGTYLGAVNPEDAKTSAAYQALFDSGYRPPSINSEKAYNVNGVLRPLTGTELAAYTVARGKAFAAALAGLGIGPVSTPEEAQAAQKLARGAYQQANSTALASVGAIPAAGGVPGGANLGVPRVKSARTGSRKARLGLSRARLGAFRRGGRMIIGQNRSQGRLGRFGVNRRLSGRLNR